MKSYSDLCEQSAHVELSIQTVSQSLYYLSSIINTMHAEQKAMWASLDFRKAKRVRTIKNRCSYIGVKGDCCKGYVSKKFGTRFCFAHASLAADKIGIRTNHNLFQ